MARVGAEGVGRAIWEGVHERVTGQVLRVVRTTAQGTQYGLIEVDTLES